jgi:hypothetical protein
MDEVGTAHEKECESDTHLFNILRKMIAEGTQSSPRLVERARELVCAVWIVRKTSERHSQLLRFAPLT